MAPSVNSPRRASISTRSAMAWKSLISGPRGEGGLDGDGAQHRRGAEHIPGQAEVGPVDPDRRVEPDLTVAPDGHSGVEGQGPGDAADGQRAGHHGVLTRQPDVPDHEGDVRVLVA